MADEAPGKKVFAVWRELSWFGIGAPHKPQHLNKIK
jgi:hypothetical protein